MKEGRTIQSHEYFMDRCLELALKGLGNVAPNPMVGAVIVHEGEVIGEGYHQKYGMPHAEAIAVNAVKDKSLLKKSILYVNLEPCSHMGKTPPCTDLIMKMKIPHVVIGTADPNVLVAGNGIDILRKNNIKVETGVLKERCTELNRRFFTFHLKKRPYIILKWAQSKDGFIDLKRKPDEPIGVNWISHPLSRSLVHKWRSEEQGIMVGTNTVLIDNPKLNVRNWEGKNPVRIILDRRLRISEGSCIYDNSSPTLIYNEIKSETSGQTEWVKTGFNNRDIKPILEHLYQEEIQSLIVEGGKELLENLIMNDLWDEARIFVGEKKFKNGLKAPRLNINPISDEILYADHLLIYRNDRNFTY